MLQPINRFDRSALRKSTLICTYSYVAYSLKMQKISPVKSQVFEDYVTSVKAKSEDVIMNIFPRKIDELNKLLDSSDFNFEDQQASLNTPIPWLLLEGSKELAVPSGTIICNSILSKYIDIVKPFIREQAEHANLLKMWVTLLIPKIEDGNNFGVSIQEEILCEIRAVEGEAATFSDVITRYYMFRGKIFSKVAKYSQIDDYRRVVAELDEKEFISLRKILSEIRNHYAALYDLIVKNWEKIIQPRSSNAENLY